MNENANQAAEGSNANANGHGGGNAQAHIKVDNEQKVVRAGAWIVADLKLAVGVDAAKVLAEITPHGLTDLDDGAPIDVKNGMRFMSHVRQGASS